MPDFINKNETLRPGAHHPSRIWLSYILLGANNGQAVFKDDEELAGHLFGGVTPDFFNYAAAATQGQSEWAMTFTLPGPNARDAAVLISAVIFDTLGRAGIQARSVHMAEASLTSLWRINQERQGALSPGRRMSTKVLKETFAVMHSLAIGPPAHETATAQVVELSPQLPRAHDQGINPGRLAA